jgi:protease PrsW
MILLLSSILPVIIIMIYLYYRDKYEKEPIRVLFLAFLGGVLAIITTLIIVYPLTNFETFFFGSAGNAVFQSFFMAAIPEESSKFLFLYWFIWKDKNFNENFDGIIYAVFVSMGFACVENILYVFEGGLGVAAGRAITAVPAHALFGVIMGYYFAHAKFKKQKRLQYLFQGLILAIVTHGIYNFLLVYTSAIIDNYPILALLTVNMFIGFVIFLHIIGFRKIKKHLESSVFRHQ